MIIGGLLAMLSSAASMHAATDKELMAAYSQMETPGLNFAGTITVSNLTIEQHDFKLVLDSGSFCFFNPLTLDSTVRSYGGVFLGKGRIQFSPPVRMEQEQLNRFFKSDSLNRSIEQALVLCDAGTCDRIRAAGQPESRPPEKKLTIAVEEMQKYLTMRQEHYYLFEALRNIATPRKQGYLFVNTQPFLTTPVFYIFDPYEREEVQFRRHYKEFVVAFYMELICSYSVYTDETYSMINGLDKEQITFEKYGIDASIPKSGDFRAATSVDFTVQMTPAQMITMYLHERLRIDSICDSTGRKISFLRYTDKHYRSTELHLILPAPMAKGEHGRLTFYYQGDIITKPVSDYWVDAGATWYPRYNYQVPATLDMTFHTPATYTFVASGRKVSQREAGDTIVSSWTTPEPVRYASFNIGHFKRTGFGDQGTPHVELYYLEELHRDSAQKLTERLHRDTTEHPDLNYGYQNVDSPPIIPWSSDVQERLAADLIASIQYYSRLFGAAPRDTIVASEILGPYVAGVSYPGFVQLDFAYSHRSDPFGRDKMVRAHEVAHEWWGQSIGTETYHDAWLSEGFATYSCLMYLQATLGNDQFLYWLNEYRKEVMSLNKYLLMDRNEAGPIALGFRTSTSKSWDDYNLIVYRKGALVLHMLRNMLLNFETMSEDRFTTMMQDYYATFKGKVVNTQDFKKLVEKHVGEDMSWFFDEWVFGNNVPTYKFDYKVIPRSDKGYDISFTIRQTDVPDSFKMYVPIEIDSESGMKSYIRVLVDKPLIEQTVSVLGKPKKVRLNPFQSVLANVNQ
jgi:hypothetical protein